ncbi:hypothetical protein TNCV_4852631 [Trichonephila clavipes]|nr:hypothetical protein TNCV_4852631 [Trichonephila clavipes]
MVPYHYQTRKGHVTRMTLMDHAAMAHALSQELGSFVKTTSVCTNRSMTFAAAWTLSSETMVAVTLEAALQTESSSIVGINDDLGRTNDETSFFQMNPGYAYNIKMVTYLFSGMLLNARCQRAFVIVIMVHSPVGWFREPIGYTSWSPLVL